MKDSVIDVAFVPVDPRLEENYILSFRLYYENNKK